MIKFEILRGNERISFVKMFTNEEYYNKIIKRNTKGLQFSPTKRLELTVLGKFTINEWNGNKYPTVEIIEMESQEVTQTFKF